ncbi:MAG: hypothetical protein R3C05_04340 [Pirellulaceae bacterium]
MFTIDIEHQDAAGAIPRDGNGMLLAIEQLRCLRDAAVANRSIGTGAEEEFTGGTDSKIDFVLIGGVCVGE